MQYTGKVKICGVDTSKLPRLKSKEATELMEKIKQGDENAKEKSLLIRFLVGAGSLAMGFILGLLSFCDYHYAGIFTVLVFYFFRGRKWWCFAGQLICLWYINFEILSGFEYVFEISGMEIHILRQGFALLALIPIWLYKGKQGLYNKGIKALYYWFYPVHLLVLGLIRMI